MTDTSRTLAEIKALLADNTTRDISPQDIRDTVESIANPVPGGGLDAPFQNRFRNSPSMLKGVYSILGSPGSAEVAELPVGVLYATVDPRQQGGEYANGFYLLDSEGWVVPEQVVDDYWGVTHRAYSTILLPPGRYIATSGFTIISNSPPTRAEAFLDWAQDNGTDYSVSSNPLGGNYNSDSGTIVRRTLGQLITTDIPFHFLPMISWNGTAVGSLRSYWFIITKVG